MNYKESKKILAEVKKAKKILLNCHKGPDPDSIGSALALYKVLKSMRKTADIICPSEYPNDMKFLKDYKQVETVDVANLDFSDYDLVICQDSASWDMVAGGGKSKQPDITTVAIDHHKTNEKYGDINLVDDGISSNAEILYLILKDWKVDITADVAQYLLTGIIGDTGVFRYPQTTAQTLKIASDLIKKGADRSEIVTNIYFNTDFKTIKFYGEILHEMQFDKAHKFVWSAVNYETFKKYGSNSDAKSMAAGAFAQSVKGAKFGIVMVEDTKNRLSISIRSKKGYDISGLAATLNGGGHESAAGGKIEGLDFEEAVKRVLSAAKKFAK